MANKVVRILQLDGGGIRGIISMQFLKMFCQQAKIQNPLDYFDVITGSSIGGICGLGLGVGKKPDQLLQLLIKKGPEIFPKGPADSKDIVSLLTVPFRNPYLYNNCYNSDGQRSDTPFVSLLKEFFKDKTMKDLPSGKGFIVTSLKYKGGTSGSGKKLTGNVDCSKIYFPYSENNMPDSQFVAFSNIKAPWTQGQENRIVDVALATSAAPIYFLPVNVKPSNNPEKDYWYIDGGLFTNSPANLALTLGKQLYPQASKFKVLSVGTGSSYIQPGQRSQEVGLPNGLRFMSQLLNYTMEGGIQSTQIPFLNSSKQKDFAYYRFQPRFPIDAKISPQTWAIDNVSKNYPNAFIQIAQKKFNDDINAINDFIKKNEQAN